MNFHPQFGRKVSKTLIERYSNSSQWNGKIFENQSETLMDINLKTLPGLLKQQFIGRKLRSPEKPIPWVPFNPNIWNKNIEKPKFIWYGHSVLLLQLNGKNLLIDPMLGPNAAPISPFAVKRFSDNSLDIIDNLPPIDMVLMTHDHYDHLDYESIKKLIPKVRNWFVALGVSRHLESWGIPTAQITEFDWWDAHEFESIKITFTPSRHFSGRGLTDRAKCLWGGWVFTTDQHNIYWSGDSGYDDHFKEVGKRLGPFDWGFMECGQYNKLWHPIHMFPEETVNASIDAGVKTSIPVHWGGFPLALHTWKDPIERFTKEAQLKKLSISTPEIGEIVLLNEESTKDWWTHLE
ncbi:MAG: MBL fold metallo-hydrolase [Roseivirga sp.]